MAPVIVARACGGWLAYSHHHDTLKIGVTGQTENDAAERFSASYARWLEILHPTLQPKAREE